MRKELISAIIAIGISSVITQLLVVREFMSIFYGNELAFGIILGNWLFLNGVGSYVGKYSKKIKNKINFLILIQILIGFLPLAMVFLIRILRTWEMLGLVHVFIYSFIITAPMCLLNGFSFILACNIFFEIKEKNPIGKTYIFDAIGDISGGVLFSFLLIFVLNQFNSTFFVLFLNLFCVLFLSRKVNKKCFISCVILFVFSISLLGINFNNMATEIAFKNQEVVYQGNSLYGHIVVTKIEDQYNFFENGIPLFSTENTIANEETAHYALIQNKNPKNILLISGGVSGTLNEILKYDVNKIDYVELDPLIIKVGKRFVDNNLTNKKVNIANIDGRLFVKYAKDKYDVVIMDLPDPSTTQINRFYTLEFFKEIKKILNDDGVISLSITSSENYLSTEAKRLNSAVYNTLKKVFLNIIVIPGDENFFLASDKKLTYEISGEIKKRGISTKYVNEDYLKAKLTNDRISYILSSIDEKIEINKDFKPITYFYHLLYWMNYFNMDIRIILIALSIFIIILLLGMKPIPFAIFTTGFAGISIEIVLLVIFQVLYGYAYYFIGIIVSCFLIGVAFGAYFANKKINNKSKRDLAKIEFIIMCFSFLIPVVTIIPFAQILIPFLVIITGFLVGFEFPLASSLFKKKEVSKTAGTLFSSDLVGSCIGSFLASVLLVPLLGIINVCILLGILNLISGLIVLRG